MKSLYDLEKDIHADAREVTARQVHRVVMKQERPDIAVSVILQAIDIWYEKGFMHGKKERQHKEAQ